MDSIANGIQISTLVGLNIVAIAAMQRQSLKLKLRLAMNCIGRGSGTYSEIEVIFPIVSSSLGDRTLSLVDWEIRFQGHKLRAMAVKEVSTEFEKVLTEQKNCQGLITDRASYGRERRLH